MSNPKLLAKEWVSFAKAIQLDRCGETQQREMRRGFYAGAASFYSAMMGNVDHSTHPDTVTDRDVKIMEWLTGELDDYAKELELEMKLQQGVPVA